ncbi:hypothetical protein [Methylobacterium sp. J-070]|uniref:hypothetical protein n=1 Tax=Methylobacterium sp. J-070 TaxID=2836650 RepID=UPI001FB9ECCF|nr:hypothetical protein [Methylobacterium sp. J-070]MCJ2048857.1 hypothetical protein [Methylobacterium sp. J-070]
MILRPVHTVVPYGLLAGLGAALFGGSGASAEERITLEVIGAVRMAGPEVIRRADAAAGRTEARPARAATADPVAGEVSSHRD